MNYNIIGSSSKGNCIIVEDKIILDCGVSYSKIKQYLKNIKLIYITHSHKDHLLPSTIKLISFNYPTIRYITGSKKVVARLYKCGVPIDNIMYFDTKHWIDIGLMKFKLEPLTHDTTNYGLHFDIKGKKGIYITDTANVDNIVAKNYDLYLIEANYKEEILKKHLLECSEEEKIYLDRVSFTHLSWEQANTFLVDNMGENSEFQYIHQSSYNFEEENNEVI